MLFSRKMKLKIFTVFNTIFVISFFLLSNSYAIPPIINYQGYLTDINGIPLNQTIDMTFKIYDQITEGTVLWQEEHKAVVIEDGIFKAYLGEISSITEDLFIADRFIGVTLGDEPEMQPRSQFTSSPYAFIAAKAISVPDNSINSEKIATQAVTTEKIANDAVTTSKIAESSITNSKISEHTIDITKLSFTPLLQEVDPQVGEMNLNDVPKWDGNALVSGSIHDTGENVGISTSAPKETLDINGALKIGNTDKENPGTIRWTSNDFEGFDGAKWVSFTKSEIKGNTIQLVAGEEIYGEDKPSPVYISDNGIILKQSNFDSEEEISEFKSVGQTFQTDARTEDILKFDLYLTPAENQTGKFKVSFYKIIDGKIEETEPHESWQVNLENIQNGWNTFDKQLDVKPLSEYAIVLQCPVGGLSWHYKNENIISNGYAISNPDGYSWSNQLNKDFAFVLYGKNRVFLSQASDMKTINAIGFAISNASPGENVLIQTDGIVQGFENLVTGREYFIQDETGAINIHPGTYNKSVGIAVSESQIELGNTLTRNDIDLISKQNADASINKYFANMDNADNYSVKWQGSELRTGSIYDDGKIGIGTTTPKAKLDVNGGIRIGRYTTADRPVCYSETTGTFIFDTDIKKPFVCNGEVWKPLDSDFDSDGIVDWNDLDDENPEIKHENLKPETIKSGVNVFEVTGTFTDDASAQSSDVKNGEIFYASGQRKIGTMAVYNSDRMATDVSSSENIIKLKLSGGYYNNGIYAYANDSDFIASNIKKGVSIFGKEGTYSFASLDGKKFLVPVSHLSMINNDLGSQYPEQYFQHKIDNMYYFITIVKFSSYGQIAHFKFIICTYDKLNDSFNLYNHSLSSGEKSEHYSVSRHESYAKICSNNIYFINEYCNKKRDRIYSGTMFDLTNNTFSKTKTFGPDSCNQDLNNEKLILDNIRWERVQHSCYYHTHCNMSFRSYYVYQLFFEANFLN